MIEPRAFLETWNLDAGVARRGFLADRVLVQEKPFAALALGFLADGDQKLYRAGRWFRLTGTRGHVLARTGSALL